MGLARQYLINGTQNPFVIAYHSYQKDMAVLLGATPAIADQDMSAVLTFEMELAKVSDENFFFAI